MAYKRPDGHWPTQINGYSFQHLVAFNPLRDLGTGVRACFPRMQWIHFGGRREIDRHASLEVGDSRCVAAGLLCGSARLYWTRNDFGGVGG
jgi:hypothetical protein